MLMAFAGLGLFLFGIYLFEDILRKLSSKSFKKIINKLTGSKLKAFFSSIFFTAIFQSSSFVTLIILSLIGVGLISLENAIAVVFGANIGTTFTAWIVAVFGFEVNLTPLFYFFIGLGGFSVLIENEKTKRILLLLFAIGLLFYGLEIMKDSMAFFSKNIDINEFKNYPLIVFLLVGFIITGIIQSSSASIAIIQSALFSGVVDFKMAAAFVIGANIGTTVTAVIGSIGGNSDKKRLALAHVLFNVSVGTAAFVFLKYLVGITLYFTDGLDNVLKIAFFHTLFNVIGVFVWFPFIDLYSKLLKKIAKDKKRSAVKYINSVDINIPNLAVDALNKEINRLAKKVSNFAFLAIFVPPSKTDKPIDKILEENSELIDANFNKLYGEIREIEGEIYKFISQLNQDENIVKLFKKTMYLATAVKSIKDMLGDIEKIYEEEGLEEFLQNIRYQILKATILFRKYLNGENVYEEIENIYDQIAKSYKRASDIIKLISKTSKVSAEINAIMINMLHLSKSYIKSLRNIMLLNSDK
jgi:phosphate:Na+ symporter